MKEKIVYVLLGIFLTSTILLSVYVAISKPHECEYVHLDDVLRAWSSWEGENDVVPDEETARKIADVVIEVRNKIRGEEYKYIEDEIIVIFNEQNYEWEVHYPYQTETENGWSLGWGTIILIRRDNGMIRDVGFF